MTRALTRSPFHSARLLRVLAELDLLEARPPGPDFAQQLGAWVDIQQAIGLRAAHGLPSTTAADASATAATCRALAQAVARMRATIEQALASSTVGTPQASRRCYSAHQRSMEGALRPLRTQLGDTLARATPALRQLAALDAAMEGILQVREARLLEALPARLERRFKQLQAADADPAHNWQARFGQELQRVLLAEWELRLQPTLGLLAALHQHQAAHDLVPHNNDNNDL